MTRDERRVRERQRNVDDARDRFIRAASALTQWWNGDNLAFALLESGRAMASLVLADTDRRAYDHVQAVIAAAKAEDQA